jgi:hypothetical protein
MSKNDFPKKVFEKKFDILNNKFYNLLKGIHSLLVSSHTEQYSIF